MKVLKFGGTSVGSPEALANVRTISTTLDGPAILVVSALDGITDQLEKVGPMAAEGDDGFRDLLRGIRSRHMDMAGRILPEGEAQEALKEKLDALLSTLERICDGVRLLQVLPEKSRLEIESFGERLSSLIVAAVIPGAVIYDALRFIKTVRKGIIHSVDQEQTERKIRETFREYRPEEGLAIVPGFISTDSETGQVSNLGRGGSDYTASLIAAALDADVLEIWTDVDGFMTADPRNIKTSYVIDEMTFEEATELCNFGAKVIYSPAMYPVHAKDIPIRIKNTTNPSAPGTVIRKDCRRSETAIRGISSIDDISILTLGGTSMAGIVGVDSLIFSVLAREGISVFLVSQSASETNISIGIRRSDALKARKALEEAFAHEIGSGALSPVSVMDDLAAVAIIGGNMRRNAGVAGKLFSILGRNGISIIAIAQGASERNISFIIERKHLVKALGVIHDGFLLSEYQEINLFLCGVGTVGGQLIEQLTHQQDRLREERNLKVNVVGIARSTKAVFDRSGIDLASWKERLEEGVPITPATLKEQVIAMNIFNAVFVDCTASAQIAALYGDLFNHGVSVVAANKIAASSDYGNYRFLKDTARRRGVKFLFETNVGAGLPIIKTINDLRDSGDRILKMEAVLSGTLNFIFNTISEDIPFSRTVRMAQEQGFSEPDPRIDLSGRDVIRKLVILSREAGYGVNQEDVQADLFIPAEFFDCPLEAFWERLPSLDERFERERKRLEAGHKRWRFVAKMEEGKLSVSLQEIPQGHSFYVLDGSNNIILLTTERYNRHPMLIQGYGAGAGVTAAGVFADIMTIAGVR